MRARVAWGSWIVVALALALALGVACATAEPGEAPVLSFDDEEWVLVEISGEPLAAGGPEATLRYDAAERRVGGSAGCNRYFGGLLEGPEGGAFRLGPVGATRMMCPPPEMELERRFLEQLGATRRWERTGERLELSGETASLVFEARPRF